MIGITTVISVEGTPVVRFAGQPPEAVIIHARVKSLRTGESTDTRFPKTIPWEDGPCIATARFDVGDPVAYTVEAVDLFLVSEWFKDDAAVPYDEWLSRRSVIDIMTTVSSPEPPAEPMTTQAQETAGEPAPEEPAEEPESEEDDDMPGGVMGCAVSELRTVLIKVLRQQGRAMTVREIAAILNADNAEARVRISTTLADMEGKRLVRRGDPSTSPTSTGRRTVTTWEVAE